MFPRCVQSIAAKSTEVSAAAAGERPGHEPGHGDGDDTGEQ